jgi:RNA polymerase sigma-70 factor (ECF subfamily)
MALCDFWPGAPPSDALESALSDFLRRANAWPELPATAVALIPWAAARIGAPHPAAIGSAPAADLHLSCACAAGDRRAHRLFDALLDSIRPALAGLGASRDEIDEVLQRLRVQLLVGVSPGIADYNGAGELRAWVRVIGVREMVRLLRGLNRAQKLDDVRMIDSLIPDIDIENGLLKEEARAAFRAAFAEAVAGLPARDRLVLRQHAVDDLGIDQIGALHGVHRATAARWITQAKSDLGAATERALEHRLHISTEEVRALLRLIMSRLDASVQRLLGNGAERPS